jgi:hypothetical protein
MKGGMAAANSGEALSEGDRRTYEMVLTRRLHHDGLVWQVPALSLTAQAFLFTIALAPDTRTTARIIAAVLSMIASFISVQLMARHRAFELVDARWLEQFEEAHGLPTLHAPADKALDSGPRFVRPLGRMRSFMVWAWGLSLFGLVGVLVIVLSTVGALGR